MPASSSAPAAPGEKKAQVCRQELRALLGFRDPNPVLSHPPARLPPPLPPPEPTIP